MAEQSSNQFKFDGKLYTFILTFVGMNVDGKEFTPITLDNAQIDMFKYENQLNQFYLKSELICEDSFGRIDKLLDKPLVQCNVMFIKMEENFDGGFSLPKYSDKVYFQHTFLVENISILDRYDKVIRYKMSLSGINILKCNANISFSNYAFEEKDKTLLNTLKACITAANLTVDQNAFQSIDTTIKTNFITNGNDNIQTIAKYILNQMFYLNKDSSLKFIRYNETSDTFMMYDIKDKNQALGISSIMLSMMNSNKEGMVSQIPVNLGTVTKFPQSKTIKSFFKHDFKDYSYNQNLFFDRTISSNEIQQYINNAPYVNNSERKFYYNLEASTLDFSIRGGYWNNDFSIYDNVINSLTKDNSLVINCSGNIIRKPGDYVILTIDRDIQNLPSERRAELADIMLRYAGLEGSWNIFRTTHIVEPAKCRYTQNLVLMRNFTIKQQ